MKIQNYLPAALCAGLISLSASRTIAQTDSTVFNTGRIQLDKNFTQTISIKGEDLEKIPFTSLHDAINVWLYGIYSNKSTLVYVIDGIMMSDVNAYSIYDIESITLVQNALSQLNGATGQQQLVLITTKRFSKGSKGLTASANASYISTKHAYQQYYLGYHNNTHKINYGISANYLRDATGENYTMNNYSTKYKTPPGINRYRFNAYANTQLGKNNELSLTTNYTPQNFRESSESRDIPPTSYFGSFNNKSGEYQFNIAARLKSSFTQRLINEFSVGYYLQNFTNNFNRSEIADGYFGEYLSHGHNDYYNFIFRDNISYNMEAGNWKIVPALNAQYRISKYNAYLLYSRSSNIYPGEHTFTSSKQTGKFFLLTPSLTFAYKNIFQIQGGFLANGSAKEGKTATKFFPFGTVTADVLKMFNPNSSSSLQLFGSFAQYEYFNDPQLKLTDLEPPTQNFTSTPIWMLPNQPPALAFSPDNQYRNWQTGIRYATANKRFEADYNFEKRDYTSLILFPIEYGGGSYYVSTYPDLRAYMHSFGIRSKLLQSTSTTWQLGLRATNISNSPTDYLYGVNNSTIIGNSKNMKTAWVGGLTNRFTYKSLFAGADIQYIFNQESRNNPQPAKMQVLFQNIYAGLQLKSGKFKNLEAYITCRNLGDMKYSSIVVNQKYAGLGVKTSF